MKEHIVSILGSDRDPKDVYKTSQKKIINEMETEKGEKRRVATVYPSVNKLFFPSSRNILGSQQKHLFYRFVYF